MAPSSFEITQAAGEGTVSAVALDTGHHFSKRVRPRINLVEGHGVEGDAHAGPYVKHRYLARRHPRLANLRQVHLIGEELLLAVRYYGFDIHPGELGENITTKGFALEQLPLGSRLAIGNDAVIELTGLRTPCILIDRFQSGLKHKLIIKRTESVPYRAGVLGIVRSGGSVVPGDRVAVCVPNSPARPLPLPPL